MDLTKLQVSLTKHGASKLASLIKRVGTDKLIHAITSRSFGIDIDEAQAKKNLSFSSLTGVPPVWRKAKDAGDESLNALVFLGIVLSHHRLIKAMQARPLGEFRGRVEAGKVLEGKEFTNFKHTLQSLGFAVLASKRFVDFDVSSIFRLDGFNRIFVELAALKMAAAGADKNAPIGDTLVGAGIHTIFSISSEKFRLWLSGSPMSANAPALTGSDADFFAGDSSQSTGEFAFVSGHTSKKTGTVDVGIPAQVRKMVLRHNEIQDVLYEQLCSKYGKANVGTEVATGHGSRIDVVVKTADYCAFYEIKVAPNLKACIRQSIPQLLEYAYWRTGNSVVIRRLIIVAEHAVTSDATAYLSNLRERFSIPIYYERFQE